MSDNSKNNVMQMQTKLVKDVKDLRVYQRAFEVSLQLHKASLDFPKIEQYALADQIRRASKSVCANLAEGFARQQHSSKEFGRFIAMAAGSSNEMQVWLQYALELGYISAEQYNVWQDDYDAILRMLQKLKFNLTSDHR